MSPNPDVKVFIGAPASSSAAGSGYVDASTIATIIEQTSSEYTSFGGVMLWDMSQAYGVWFLGKPIMDETDWVLANNRYDTSVKDALTGGSGGGTVTTTTTTTTSMPATSTTPPTTTTVATTTSAGTGSCAGVSAWESDVAVSLPPDVSQPVPSLTILSFT